MPSQKKRSRTTGSSRSTDSHGTDSSNSDDDSMNTTTGTGTTDGGTARSAATAGGATAGAVDPNFSKAHSVLLNRTPYTAFQKQSLLITFSELNLSGLGSSHMAEQIKTHQMKIIATKPKTKNTMKNKWAPPVTAHHLATLYQMWIIYNRQSTSTDVNTSTRNHSYKTLKAFMNKMEKVLGAQFKKEENDLLEKEVKDLRKANKIAKKQSNNTNRIQDIVAFDATKVDTEPCPDCGHLNVTVMDTIEEIDDYNQRIENENKIAIARYNRKTVTEKANTTKPRTKKKRAQSFACYCCKTSCLNQTNGGNCGLCRDGTLLCEVAGHTQCMCAVCNCKCSVHFTRNERSAVALAAVKRRLNKEGGWEEEEAEPDGRTILANIISNSAASGSILAHQVNPSGSLQDLRRDSSAIAFQSIAANPSLQLPAVRCQLQKAIGPLPHASNVGGYTIDQLRAHKNNSIPIAGYDVRRQSRFMNNKLGGNRTTAAAAATATRGPHYCSMVATAATTPIRRTGIDPVAAAAIRRQQHDTTNTNTTIVDLTSTPQGDTTADDYIEAFGGGDGLTRHQDRNQDGGTLAIVTGSNNRSTHPGRLLNNGTVPPPRNLEASGELEAAAATAAAKATQSVEETTTERNNGRIKRIRLNAMRALRREGDDENRTNNQRLVMLTSVASPLTEKRTRQIVDDSYEMEISTQEAGKDLLNYHPKGK